MSFATVALFPLDGGRLRRGVSNVAETLRSPAVSLSGAMKLHLKMLRYFIHDVQNPKKFIKRSKQTKKFTEGETN